MASSHGQTRGSMSQVWKPFNHSTLSADVYAFVLVQCQCTISRRASEIVSSWWRNHGDFKCVQCCGHVQPCVFLEAQQMSILNVVRLLVSYLSSKRCTTSPIPMSKFILGTLDEDSRVVVVLCTRCATLDTMETTRGRRIQL